MSAEGSVADLRVLVTGAGGFVGRHLTARLRQGGAEVVPVTRTVCDLRDRDAVRRTVEAADADVLLHLAATRSQATADDRDGMIAVNTLSASWAVEGLTDRCRVAVTLGSSTEYDGAPRPLDESASTARSRGFFGATKAAGSVLFLATAAARGIPAHVLRAFQVYGPGDKPHRFVPTVLSAAARDDVVPLTGPGLRRDWVWVGDVVEACLLAASTALPTGSVFNIGTGVQTSNEDLVRTAERVTGRRIRTAVGAHPGREWDTDTWVADARRARAELGWEPTTDLADGLARCWAA